MKTLAVLLVLVTLAHADTRHSVAVLGVVPKDAALAKSAGAITRELRSRAAKDEYDVKGAAKDIDAAMLASECDSMQPGCAARLGAGLGTEYVIAGSLERRGTHAELVLTLVDVERKRRVASVHQSGTDPKKLARAAYTRLTGGDLGDLAIEANAQNGDVLIDGQVVAALFEGRTTLTGLLKGSHMLAIRAKGYKPLEVDVTIEAQTRQMLLLDPDQGPPSGK